MSSTTTTSTHARLQLTLEQILGSAARERYFAAVPEDREAISSSRFLAHQATLEAGIRRGVGGDAAYAESIDLRPAASRFVRQYAAALLPAVLTLMAQGVAVDASAERCLIVIRNHLPGGLSFMPDDGHVPRISLPTGSDRFVVRAAVLDRLFNAHLRPLVDAVLRVVKVAPDLLWSNVGEHTDLFYDPAVAACASEPVQQLAFQEDWDVLVRGEVLPGVPGPNPIRGWMTRDPVDEPGLPRLLPLRTICCIHYELPDRVGRLCSDCPLATREERVLQARHMRGLPAQTHAPRLAAGNVSLERSAYLDAGDIAPEFALPSTENRTISLAEFRDKQPIVLFFYVKDGSPACSAEAASFRDHLERFQASGVAVVGVGPDSVESHREFAAKLGLTYPLLADEGSLVAKRYGAWQVTHLRSRDRSAIAATTFVIGSDSTIKAVFMDIRGNVHAEQVLAALGPLDLGGQRAHRVQCGYD
jgi:peroxiredoxin Q/BCP